MWFSLSFPLKQIKFFRNWKKDESHYDKTINQPRVSRCFVFLCDRIASAAIVWRKFRLWNSGVKWRHKRKRLQPCKVKIFSKFLFIQYIRVWFDDFQIDPLMNELSTLLNTYRLLTELEDSGSNSVATEKRYRVKPLIATINNCMRIVSEKKTKMGYKDCVHNAMMFTSYKGIRG